MIEMAGTKKKGEWKSREKEKHGAHTHTHTWTVVNENDR